MVAGKKGTRYFITDFDMENVKIPYLSNVAFVVCFKAFTADLCVASKFVLYSFMEDSGQRSFEMTQASKKLPFDSHRVTSLVSFWPSVSPATG